MTPDTEAAPGWPAFLAALKLRNAAIALAAGVAAAALLNPIFITPFPVLLGRTLFLAAAMLLTEAAARQWPERWRPRWLPGWMVPLLAVALAAPLATLPLYLAAAGGDIRIFMRTPERVMGFFLISSAGLVLGVLLTGGALVRERLARAQAQQLQFELERSRLEKQALDARMLLLQAQIEPHFLFNTLANVQALVEAQSPRAPAVLQSLIAYLRAALPRLHEGEPTLGQELALVRAYLKLMQMRMPDRLHFSVDVDAALASERFPPMALLTLVENAVHHGIDPAEDGGHIEVGAAREPSGALRLWVADSGVGLDPRAPPGTGLSNLRARLQGFFGPQARLQLGEQPPRGVRAEIQLPPAAAAR
ncbi:MAG: histidine kinase [Rubrivivax sp.]|nr:histidine kinase [Rubrivivax sp.]